MEQNHGDTRSVSPGLKKASVLYRERVDETTSL